MKPYIYLIFGLLILYSCVIKINPSKGNNGERGTSKTTFNQNLADSLGADQYGMKAYVMVILKTGSKKIEDKDKMNILMRGHLDNIGKLAKENKLTIAGPFSGKNDKNYRGLFILNVKTKEEAEAIIKTDPAVAEGIFDYEIYPWYGSAALPLYLKYTDQISKEKP